MTANANIVYIIDYDELIWFTVVTDSISQLENFCPRFGIVAFSFGHKTLLQLELLYN